MAELILSDTGLEENLKDPVSNDRERQRASLNLLDVHWNINPSFGQPAACNGHRVFLSHLSFHSING